MTRDSTARMVTIAILLLAAGVGIVRKTGWRGPEPNRPELNQPELNRPEPNRLEPGPPDAIYSMLDAARAGDVRAYLAHYTGPLEATLRQTLAESTEPAFARYLKDTNAAIKGTAVSDPEKIGDREAKVRVEYIYQDRNEAQTIYLEKGPGGWKISRAETGDRIQTLVPYGTPVK